ncbi:acetate--CoA ligase family protein [Phyllobacterium chamaecytisi]|uniref:acetate--CoA ligase family protein n=1 Tax=Phyllobacterium chamaecytisi TaxID=2876082 RepID=UPI001CCE8279|nr:acetate--CoA ligase family protein [Phyllobacterium sp. KW56]MBZ9603051.1 acetate--CoA ligase family protein [Phyllobacterium sp. KW56]
MLSGDLLRATHNPASQNIIAPGGSERLNWLFRPESIAIVGASQKGGFATELLANIVKWDFQGKVVAVNPRYEEIGGVPCFASLSSIPHPVDLAIIVVPSKAIPQVLEDCEKAGVRAIQIISSGFAEQAGEGEEKQRWLVKWAQRTGIPVVGPNCFGLMNAANRLMAVPLDFHNMKAGGISAILQSGTLVYSLIVPLLSRGMGIGRVATIGNEACVDLADFIDYFVDDDETRVITCYCEQIKRPLAFIRACERAADKGKPIVMIKVGRSEAARSAALAHTGAMVGSDVAIDAALKKLGVIRVDTIDDLIETTAALSSMKRPRGRRIAVASFSGSAVSLLSDYAASNGINFPPLPADVKARLKKVFPEFGSLSNPLDLTAQGDYDTRIIDESLDALATCGAYDVVVWARGFPSSLDMRSAVGKALTRAGASAPDVVFSVLSLAGGHFHASLDPKSVLVEPRADIDGMPFLQGMETGFKGLTSLINYSEFLRSRKPDRKLSEQYGLRSDRFQDAMTIIKEAKGELLTEREGKRLLALYDIPVTREALATSAGEAARFAEALTLPVAMKIEATEIVHKTDVGGVVLNIPTPDEAAVTFETIVASVKSHHPRAEIGGVLVQQMVDPGVEVIVGANFDPQFGPVIAFGLGGIWVESLKDVRIILPPFDANDVLGEIKKLRAASVLQGARGGGELDLKGLADCIVNFGRLCSDLAGEVAEIDVNPIILSASGTGLTAVDCLIRKKTSKPV